MGEAVGWRWARCLHTAACAALGVVLCGAAPSRSTAFDKPLAARPETTRPSRAPSSPERTQPLPSGWYNPMPGGVLMGYPIDTGLDIAGFRVPVYAVGAGRLLYSEGGHTLWEGPRDDDLAVLLELDTPVPFRGRSITHVWYAHLSEVRFAHAYGLPGPRVAAGERLGTSGIANGCPHLHIGMLLDRHIRQRYEWLLRDDEIRSVLGYRRGQRLPRR